MAKGKTIKTSRKLLKLFLQFSFLFSLSILTGFITPGTQNAQQCVKTEWVVQVSKNKKRTVIFQPKIEAPKYFVESDFTRILLLQAKLFRTSARENLQKVLAFKRPDPSIKRRPVPANADGSTFLKG
jgi:hypothetical protein